MKPRQSAVIGCHVAPALLPGSVQRERPTPVGPLALLSGSSEPEVRRSWFAGMFCLLIMLCVAACDAAERADPAPMPAGPAGGTLSTCGGPGDGDARQLPATELLRLGRLEGDESYVFAGITDLALGPDGRIYVLDRQSRELRIFDAGGAHLRTAGRHGAGPGEFMDPRGIRWHPDGTLWVMDRGSQRYTVLSADGEFVTTHPRRVPAIGSRWEGGFDRMGRLYDTGFVRRGDEAMSPVYIRHDVQGAEPIATDTFALPTGGGDSYVVSSRQGMFNLPVPFAPRTSWAFDGDDGVWWGNGDRYRIVRHSLAGDTTHIVELDRTAGPVSSAERAAARARIDSVIRSIGADPASIDYARIPRTKPVHGRLFVDEARRLWIVSLASPGASPEGADGTRFDVVSSGGCHLGWVKLDVGENLPVAVNGALLAGVNVSELGVHTVAVYALGF